MLVGLIELLMVQHNGLRIGHVLRTVVIPEMGTVQHYSVNLWRQQKESQVSVTVVKR